MDMLRITANWTGFSGGPGYTNFFFAAGGGLISDATQVGTRVRDALLEIGSLIPTGTSITIEGEGAIVDSDTGEVTDYEPVDVEGYVEGSGTGPYTGASGAVVNWTTADVRFGRRIRGRTFLVPFVMSAFDDQGTLSTNALTRCRGFADAMVGGDFDSEFGVWSRPRNGSGGVFATATGYRVPDLAAVLRSRRD